MFNIKLTISNVESLTSDRVMVQLKCPPSLEGLSRQIDDSILVVVTLQNNRVSNMTSAMNYNADFTGAIIDQLNDFVAFNECVRLGDYFTV